MSEPHAEVLDALDDVVDALQETCAESESAARDAEILRDHSRAGVPLRDAFSGTDDPPLVQRISWLQRRLGAAASRLRRVQARRLHGEGMSTERIAELYGVTRQRISALLRSSPPT